MNMKAKRKPIEASERDSPSQQDVPEDREPENPPSSLVKVEIAAQSHTGNSGHHNEDHYLVVRLERSLQTVLSNLPEDMLPRSFDESIYGMVVADGMGGMPAGALASSLALHKLVDLVVKTPDWIMRMTWRKAGVVKRRMKERFRQIDLTLREKGAKDPRLAGMGTTLTVACSLGADLFLAHIGDTRAYLLRGNELHQLTRDHTMAQTMIDAGIGEAENALVRGMRRVLTAALGSTINPCDPDVQRLRLKHNDQVLLCTSGLIESVDAEMIAAILRRAKSAHQACRELMGAALLAGGNDNITVVLAYYHFPQTVTQNPPDTPKQITDP
jgi:serine/threonine protein phosphatase PrpC